MGIVLKNIDARLKKAVSTYWRTLAQQSNKQKKQGNASDPGGRAAATGGKQMDGFDRLIKQILVENGMPDADIHIGKNSNSRDSSDPQKSGTLSSSKTNPW